MDDLEKYLRDTSAELCPARVTMGDPSTWDPDGSFVYMHPTREGEMAARYLHFVDGFELAPGFARECFEASKNGINPLIQFARSHYPEE